MAELRFFMDGGNMFTAITDDPNSLLQFENVQEAAHEFAVAMRANDIEELENLINTGNVFTQPVDGAQFVDRYIRGTRQALWGERVLYTAPGPEDPDVADEGILEDFGGDGVADGMETIGNELLEELGLLLLAG